MSLFTKQYNELGGLAGLSKTNMQMNDLIFTKMRERASGEIRYAFHGGTLPAAIENAAKALRRSFYTLSEGKTIPMLGQNGGSLTIRKVETSSEEDDTSNAMSKTIVFESPTGTLDQIVIVELDDPLRGSYPTTGFFYNDNLYRPIPKHGDVLNHLHHQSDIMRKEVLIPLKKGGVISDNQFNFNEFYHNFHDLDELGDKSCDTHAESKEATLDQRDTHDSVVKNILQGAGQFNPTQIAFSNRLFHLLDTKSSLIGAHERVVYCVNAVEMFDEKYTRYLNAGNLLPADILGCQMKYFMKENNVKVTIHEFLKGDMYGEVPLVNMPFTKKFFNEHAETIDTIITQTQQEINDQGYEQRKFFVSNKAKAFDDPSQPSSNEEINKAIEKRYDTLKRQRETVQKEQLSISEI